MDFQKITFFLFVICGAISLYIRLRFDVTNGSAMLGKSDWDDSEIKSKKLYKHQLTFSILTVIFLILCILLGVLKTYGYI